MLARKMGMISPLMISVRAGRTVVIACDTENTQFVRRRNPCFFHRVRRAEQSIGGQVEKQYRDDERNNNFVLQVDHG